MDCRVKKYFYAFNMLDNDGKAVADYKKTSQTIEYIYIYILIVWFVIYCTLLNNLLKISERNLSL